MRPLKKPDIPDLQPTYSAYAIALTNALGEYCAFCEKALNFTTYLFHKITGKLPFNATLGRNDWIQLLPMCGECGDRVANISPGSKLYIWPDSPQAQQLPFQYVKRDNVSYKVLDPAGNVAREEQRSYVFVEPAVNPDTNMMEGARNMIDLFKLNTKHYNNDPSQPMVTVPYDDFVKVTDVRLDRRILAYNKSVRMTENLKEAFPTLQINRSFVDNIFVLAKMMIEGIGFISTWEAAFKRNMDPDMLRQIVAPEATQILTREEEYVEIVDELLIEEMRRSSKRRRIET